MPPKNAQMSAWTNAKCVAGCNAHATFNQMSCGTNPNPKNAFCIQKTEAQRQQCIKSCPQK